MSPIFVTIAIPTYNRASSLRQYSLPAIAALQYPNYEVIVVDDGSTDDTQDVLTDYQSRLKNFRSFRNQPNRGTPFSRNRVLEQARGDIIVFVDDDVSLFPDAIDEMVALYTRNPDAMIAWGCVYQCHGNHDPHQPTFGTGSLFSMRRAIAQSFRFDTNLRYFTTYACEEHEFVRRVQRNGFQLVKATMAQANHYQAPAKNRPLRGLGGDLNYLYEKLKQGSLIEYYKCLLWGCGILLQRLMAQPDQNAEITRHPFKQAIYTPQRVLVFLRQGQWGVAAQWLFYVLIDIPMRASWQGAADAKRSQQIVRQNPMGTGLKSVPATHS